MRIFSHSGPPRSQVFQKKPCLANGVLITHKEPWLIASIGRTASYITSSTRDASSITSIETAENPRTVSSFPGSPTIRDPFGKANETSLSPSPRGRIPSLPAKIAAFLTNSPLCRDDGDTTITRLSGFVYARCTALAAVTVDLPHCRVQFTITRF